MDWTNLWKAFWIQFCSMINFVNLTTPLLKEFLILVGVANLIAFPITLYFASQWLPAFASREEIDPMLFVITLPIASGVTLIALSFQTIRAALNGLYKPVAI